MAERKQTPDILSEILAGSPAPQSLLERPAVPKRAVKTSSKPSPKPTKRVQQKKSDFEYEVASFQEYRGWRCRYVNGSEILNWMSAPLIHEYIQQRASEGWELVAATSGEQLYSSSDKRQLFFRRLAQI